MGILVVYSEMVGGNVYTVQVLCDDLQDCKKSVGLVYCDMAGVYVLVWYKPSLIT